LLIASAILHVNLQVIVDDLFYVMTLEVASAAQSTDCK